MNHGEAPLGQLNDLVARFNQGRHVEVEAPARALVSAFPTSGDAWHILGLSLLRQNKEALSVLKRAAALLPRHAEVHCNLGVAQERAQRLEEAEASYRTALNLDPRHALAHRNLGNVLRALGQLEAAKTCCETSIHINPDDPEAHLGLGRIFRDLKQFELAENSYQNALALQPNYSHIYNLLGELYTIKTYLGQSTFDQAIEFFRSSLALDPGNFVATLELKNIFFLQGRLIDAKIICEDALLINPDIPEIRQELSTTLAHLSDYTNVVRESNRAIGLKNDHARIWEQRLYSFSYHPDLMAEEIFKEFITWGDRFPSPKVDFTSHDRTPGRRLRIGYVSPDFRKHTSRFYFWPLFANHDRAAFELFAYSNVEKEVAWTRLFKTQFDHWHDIRTLSDKAVAERVKADGIDILVDLCSHMQDARLELFTLKPAPIQATWLGAAWTTGLSMVDYVLYDPYLAPEGTLARETILRLPATFIAFRPPEATADLVPAPCLKNGHITFGYTGRTERLNHRTFTVWGEILRRLPAARLVLDFGPFADPKTQAYYREFLGRHGVDVSRVTMKKSPNIFQGLNDIDILLDSFPHSGGTMLMDAFWMGVPAVTLAGRPPLGRICTSMLMNLGLPEWIAATEAEYIEKACVFAGQPDLLNDLRLGFRARMKASPLMDGPAFARGVEDAYRTMFDRWLRATDRGQCGANLEGKDGTGGIS